MAFWALKTGTPATDIALTTDSGTTVDGLRINFDSLQDESEAENISRFERDCLKPVGSSLGKINATYHLDSVGDIFTVTINKSGDWLYNMDRAIDLGNSIRYAKNQTLDKTANLVTLVSTFANYANRLNPYTTYVDESAGLIRLRYAPMADVTGTNSFQAHTELFTSFVAKHLGTVILNSLNFTYSLSVSEFRVMIDVGESSELRKLALKIADITATIATGPVVAGNIFSFFNAYRAALITLAT